MEFAEAAALDSICYGPFTDHGKWRELKHSGSEEGMVEIKAKSKGWDKEMNTLEVSRSRQKLNRVGTEV